VLSETDCSTAQLIVSKADEGTRQVQLVSLADNTDPTDPESWNLHMRAQLRERPGAFDEDADHGSARLDVETVRSRCLRVMTHAEFYGDFWVQGPDAGPSFRWIENVWMGSDEAIACTALPDIPDDPAGFQLYPGVIEACFQVLRACREFESQTLLADGGYIYVPFSIGRLELAKQPAGNRLWCYARIRNESNELNVVGDLLLADESGDILAIIDAFNCRRLPQETLHRHLHSNTRDWLYQPVWQPVGLPPAVPAAADDAWMILDDGLGVGEAVAAELEAAGHRAVRVRPANGFSVDANGDYTVNPTAPADFEELLATAGRKLPKDDRTNIFRGIINLWGLADKALAAGGEGLIAAMQFGSASALHLAQAVIASGWSNPPSLWLVTRGVQAVGDQGGVDPVQSPLWGLARVLVQEHPEIRVRCVDLSPQDPSSDVLSLVRELYNDGDEDQLAYRGSRRYVARLVRYVDQQVAKPASPLIRHDVTYLVTGGTGGLGMQVAHWLVAEGARHLVLSSRRGANDALSPALETLQRTGAEIRIIASDIGQAASLERLLTEISDTMPTLTGIIHAAGALDDGILTQQSWERFLTVYQAKVLGTWNLHEQTAWHDLDFFVCFSSASALLGAPGQGNYAAANAYMDSLMHWRRKKGLPGLSINWGPWAKVGMAAALGERECKRSSEQGWSPIDPETGLNVLGDLMRGNAAQVGVLPLHWGKFSRSLFDSRPPGFLKTWQPQAQDLSLSGGLAAKAEAAAHVLSASAEQREEMLWDYVTRVVGDLLGHNDMDPKLGFAEMGMDSLMGVELRSILQKSLKVSLASTFAFDHSNIDDVVQYLLGQLFGEDKSDSPERGAADTAELSGDLAGSDLSDVDLGDVKLDESVEAELTALEQELGKSDA
jgi:hypothetical protein